MNNIPTVQEVRAICYDQINQFAGKFFPLLDYAIKNDAWPFNTEENDRTKAVDTIIGTLHSEVFGGDTNRDTQKVKAYLLSRIRSTVQGKEDAVSKVLLDHYLKVQCLATFKGFKDRRPRDIVTHPAECFITD